MSDGQYAKLAALLQYWASGTLIPVTRAPENRQLRHTLMTAKKLEQLLESGARNPLQRLIRTARDMESLASGLRRALPPDAAASLVAANLREGGELVVIAESSAWASRFRFEEQALLAVARELGHDAASLRVRVAGSRA